MMAPPVQASVSSRSGGLRRAIWPIVALLGVTAAFSLFTPGASQVARWGLEASGSELPALRAVGLVLFCLFTPLAAGEVIAVRLPAAVGPFAQAAPPLLIWGAAAAWWPFMWWLTHWATTGRMRPQTRTLLEAIVRPWSVPTDGWVARAAMVSALPVIAMLLLAIGVQATGQDVAIALRLGPSVWTTTGDWQPAVALLLLGLVMVPVIATLPVVVLTYTHPVVALILLPLAVVSSLRTRMYLLRRWARQYSPGEPEGGRPVASPGPLVAAGTQLPAAPPVLYMAVGR